jgi:hypothetical protein
MPYKSNKRDKRQMEIPGSTNQLEEALDDLSDRLEDAEKAKEVIPPARERLAEMMVKLGKESIKHRGRSFSVKETPSVVKLSVRKEKES